MDTAIVVSDDPKALSQQERTDLVQCEEVIGRGLQSFVEVGRAFQRVRDCRLYRADFDTFEDYCLVRWQMSRAHANRYIDGSKVVGLLSPIGDIPANEAQARPLVRIRTKDGKLDSRAIARVWRKVVDAAPVDGAGRKVITAKVVEEAVEPMLQRRARPRILSVGSGGTPTAIEAPVSPVDAVVDSKIAKATQGAPQPLKENITSEQYVALHGLALWLKRLTAVSSMQMSPQDIRQCVERICKIVLEA